MRSVMWGLVAGLLLTGCVPAYKTPICQAIVNQVDNASSTVQLDHAERLYRRHCE